MRPFPIFARSGTFVLAIFMTVTGAGPSLGEDVPSAPGEIARSSDRLETTLSRPKAFGTQDYTVTVIPAIAFLPEHGSDPYGTSGSFGRFGPTNTLQNFYAPIDLPPGAIVDFIGLNSQTDAPFALGVALRRRYESGSVTTLGEFSTTVHTWATEYNAVPLNAPLLTPTASNIVHVQQGVLPTAQYFGHVEVWWRRIVSSPPVTSRFNDVPTDHPFFQFIEALAASGITAGCGDGTNFCPNNPVTRGQMAVFLAKALGLHWGSQR